uniref:Conotoxin superfamily O1 n=1 Tax=Conus ermineus TaxID=55423 RepID=A0A346CJC8_CONER|nr:conotoxin precursor superfamily O1 [Conus ermineus]
MKLTCVLIVAVLFLSACQLITADDSREKQGYSAVRSSDKIQDSDDLKLTKRCTDGGALCDPEDHDCCGECLDYGDGTFLCEIVAYAVSR